MTDNYPTWTSLTEAAVEAAQYSTSPAHVVGAAILSDDGSVHVGANIEANNHRSTIHAEDAAIADMLMSRKGARATRIVTVAADYDEEGDLSEFYYTYPCGSCRNILFEATDYGATDELEVWWDTESKKLSAVYPIGLDNVPVS